MANVTTSGQDTTAWVGWVYFAGFILILNGFFQATMGLVALFNSQFYAITQNTLVVLDISAWGWIHLLLGIIMVAAGSALFTGKLWARIFAVIMVIASIITQLMFISVYPIWSVIAIIISFVVIYALTVHGSEAVEEHV